MRLIQITKGNSKTLYLLGECHIHENNHASPKNDTAYSLIFNNAKAANELVDVGKVDLIGLEGYNGGYSFRYNENCEYAYNYDEDIEEFAVTCLANTDEGAADHIGEITLFPNKVNNKLIMYGIDSEGISDLQERILNGEQIEGHTYRSVNSLRSKHFVKTIVELAGRKQVDGSVLLYCGVGHVEEIVKLAKNDGLDEANKYDIVKILSTQNGG